MPGGETYDEVTGPCFLRIAPGARRRRPRRAGCGNTAAAAARVTGACPRAAGGRGGRGRHEAGPVTMAWDCATGTGTADVVARPGKVPAAPPPAQVTSQVIVAVTVNVPPGAAAELRV